MTEHAACDLLQHLIVTHKYIFPFEMDPTLLVRTTDVIFVFSSFLPHHRFSVLVVVFFLHRLVRVVVVVPCFFLLCVRPENVPLPRDGGAWGWEVNYP